MARSKRDILDTEAMLERLAQLLESNAAPMWRGRAQARTDAESLRRISITLRNWHELECNADVQRFIPKMIDGVRHYIVAEESGRPYIVDHNGSKPRYHRIDDREAGARKRLAAILKRYPTLTAYVQTDPRGCALYILKPGDVPEGADVSSYYSRGLAVFK